MRIDLGRTGVGRWLARALAAVAVLSVLACAATFEIHGYVPSDEELSFIKVGKDTRESVAKLIGEPSAQGLLNDVGWFYVQSHWRTFGVRPPQEIGREVLAITFTEKGVVENIERFALQDGNIVTLSRRVTTTNIKGEGFLHQLFGNVGGLNTAQIIK